MTAAGAARSLVQEVYRIEGMDCADCANGIAAYLRSLPYVADAAVSFASGKLTVRHAADSGTIIRQVARAGYRAVPPGEAADRKSGDRWFWTETAAMFLTGLLYLLAGWFHAAGYPPQASQALYLGVMLAGGQRPARAAWAAIQARRLDMNLLMALAAAGAVAIGEFGEAAAVVWLYALGTLLQSRAMERTRRSIAALLPQAPDHVHVLKEGRVLHLSTRDVRIGDTVVVKTGEILPVDGVIRSGRGSLHEASITGEAEPAAKGPGAEVYAGTVNMGETLQLEVTRPGDRTVMARLLQIVEEARERKSPVEASVDRFAAVYTPSVFGLALAVALLPPLLAGGAWLVWLYRGLELLVVGCPCALVISTPVAVVSAMGRAARLGILIKHAGALEVLGRVRAAALDKTGTLTQGFPKVAAHRSFSDDRQDWLGKARTLEEMTAHPLAESIAGYCRKLGANLAQGSSFEVCPGLGAQARFGGEIWRIGSLDWFRREGVGDGRAEQWAGECRSRGRSTVFVGTEARIVGGFAVGDSLRPEAGAALRRMRLNGIRHLAVLSGDHPATVSRICRQLPVQEIRGGLLPHEKSRQVEQLRKRAGIAAMVGDGLNDAPALSAADVGIAMGGAGSAAAMETADVVLMADNLRRLPDAFALGQRALRAIRQNIALSLAVKLAAVGLILAGSLQLWMAVLSDTGAAMLVIGNSLRLLAFGRR